MCATTPPHQVFVTAEVSLYLLKTACHLLIIPELTTYFGPDVMLIKLWNYKGSSFSIQHVICKPNTSMHRDKYDRHIPWNCTETQLWNLEGLPKAFCLGKLPDVGKTDGSWQERSRAHPFAFSPCLSPFLASTDECCVTYPPLSPGQSG